jgi:hypothetical protein
MCVGILISEFIALILLVGIFKNFDIYYNGYIQTHCPKKMKIKRADQILPEVYGTKTNKQKHNTLCVGHHIT